jgi:cytochrome c oxidase subunit 1
MHSSAASDAQQQDTYFIVAHIHYVLFGGSIMALLSGVYYWFPKITGRMMDETLGKINFWLVFVSMNITFFPMHFIGLDGMPRRIYTYDPDMGWNMWNMVATVGSFALAFSILVFIVNAVRSARKGELAGGDPWDGRTLEWSISSPPPEYNFAQIPTARGIDTFWIQKREGVPAVPVAGGSGEDDGHGIHLPQPSYWPFLASLGLFVGGYGLVYFHSVIGIAFASAGAMLTMVSVYAWSFEPVNDPEEDH